MSFTDDFFKELAKELEKQKKKKGASTVNSTRSFDLYNPNEDSHAESIISAGSVRNNTEKRESDLSLSRDEEDERVNLMGGLTGGKADILSKGNTWMPTTQFKPTDTMNRIGELKKEIAEIDALLDKPLVEQFFDGDTWKELYADISGEKSERDVLREIKKDYQDELDSLQGITRTEKKSSWFNLPENASLAEMISSVGATLLDTGLSVAEGIVKPFEGVSDLILHGASEAAGAVGWDEAEEFLRDSANLDSIGGLADEIREGYIEDNTIYGDKGRGIPEAIGQIVGIGKVGQAFQLAGKGAAAISASTTGTMFASSMGSGISEAYQHSEQYEKQVSEAIKELDEMLSTGVITQDVYDGEKARLEELLEQNSVSSGEAWSYGLMKGAIDALSELAFGGLGNGVNALGYSRGISSIDDAFAKKLSDKIASVYTNQHLKRVVGNGVEYVVKAGAEGVEEVFAGLGTAVAKKLTYMSDEELTKLIEDEDLLEQFVVSFIASGVVQGGDLSQSIKNDIDFITGLNANEQAVVDKEVEKRIEEAEKDGTKLSNKDKNKIVEQVKADLDKGYISTDTIEEVLGGDSYKEYQDTVKSEDALATQEKTLRDEFNTLNRMKKGDMTGEQSDRLEELRTQLSDLTTKIEDTKKTSQRDFLQRKYKSEVYEIAKSGRLAESYNERTRRGEAYQADLSKYDEKQKAIVQKAIDSGILNNTNRTHEFVDIIAKIAADKGVSFDFVNNAKLKESGFAIEGKTVNGYITKDGIAINMDSPQAWQSTVGHEITHVLEGTELYTELQQALFDYAKTKGDYQGRFDTLTKLYEGVKDADIQAELTADLVGDYLFQDADFVNNLSAKHRNVFQKIFDEIKYLLKVTTAGTKEARQLEKVKHVFEQAYKAQKNTAGNDGVTFSMSGEKSKIADTQKLANAELMLEQGVDSEAIRQETGWFKSYDGKWRYEIDDSKAEWNLDGAKPDQHRLFYFGEKVYKLSDLLDHKELFEAYPQLKDVTVYSSPTIEHGNGSVVGRNTDSMSIGDIQDDSTTKWAIIHELQHIIQNIEGFARGSSKYEFTQKEWGDKEYDAFEKRNEVARKLYNVLRRNGVSISNEAIYEEQNYGYGYKVSDEIIESNYWTLSSLANSNKRTQALLDEYYEQVRILNATTPEGQYHNTAGEIEAYDTMARMRMSEEERKAKRPNIDAPDAIVLGAEESGTSATWLSKNEVVKQSGDALYSISKDIENSDNSWYNEITLPAAEQARVQSEALTWNAGRRNQLITQTLSNEITYRYMLDDDGIVHVYEREAIVDINEMGEDYGNTDTTQPDSIAEELWTGQRDNGGDSWLSQDGREPRKNDTNDNYIVSREGQRNGTGYSKNRTNAYGRPKKRHWHFNEDGSTDVTYSDGSKEILDIAPTKEASSADGVFFDGNDPKSSDTDTRFPLSEVVEETNETLKDVGLELDSKSKTVSFSLSSLEDSFNAQRDELGNLAYGEDYIKAREEYVSALAKSIAVDKGKPTAEEIEKADRYLDSLFLVHDMIAADRDRLDYEAAINKSAWVSNAEYGGSIDFSTLCAKRRLFTGTFDAIQEALPDTVLNENDFLRIRNMLLENDLESPCSMCYVEGSRAKHGEYVSKFLQDYLATNPEWKPQIADFTSSTRLEQTRINHPEAYQAYQTAMNKLAQRKPKEASVRTDYKGEILVAFEDGSSVEIKNKNGGIRFNSFSDFEIIHALDAMQVITDMARVGLNGQAYTKVKEFAECFGNTGLKINLSLVAKDVDANGKLIYDEVNGMKYAEAMDIRNRYSENVGSVIVVFNEDQLKAALADPEIDYVLPFHRSQWKKSQYAMMGLPGKTKDYTQVQNDRIRNPQTGRPVKLSKLKQTTTYTNDITGETFEIKDNIMPNQYWDFNKSGRENAQRYLDYINANGMTPKFDSVLEKVNGEWVLPEGAIGDGYYKLLIDFKMYDNDGWGAPQNPVVPEFNMPYIQEMLNNYTGGHKAFPVAHDVVDAFVEGKKNGQFSLSDVGDAPVGKGTPLRDLRLDTLSEDVPVFDAPVKELAETAQEMFPDDYAPLTEEETAARQNELLDSITDEDAPPEMDAPYYGEEEASTPTDPFENRDIKDVGNRKVKAYMYENPEVKPFFQEEANIMLGELNDTVKGERIYTETDLGSVWTGTSRYTSDDIAYLRDAFGYTYAEIEKGLNAIIEDNGKENIAVAKRLEFILNDRLKQGYTDFRTGMEIPANRDYVNLLNEKQIAEYSDEARQRYFEASDQLAPPMEEDIAPVAEAQQETTQAEEDAPVADKPIQTVKDRLEAKLHSLQAELESNGRLREESKQNYDNEIARLEAEYAARKNKNTKAANDLLRRIERTRRFKDSVDADYAKRISDLEARVASVGEELRTGESPTEQRAMRGELHKQIIDNTKTRFAEKGFDFDEVLKNAKDLSTIATVDNTPQRVMEKSLGYKEGQILSDITVNKVAQNETEAIKWLNSFTNKKDGLLARISKQYGIKPGSKESAAAQMYAEGFYVGKDNSIIQYGDAELAKDFPDAKARENIKGLAKDQRIRQIYDETLAKINESRARNAYPEIPKLDNYFLHFRAMEDTFSRLGLPFNPNDIKAKDLPTDLNGVTADLKPGQPYFASAMHRRGQRTSFDLLGGLEKYLSSAKNQIYHIDDIQTLRALRNYIADTYGQANGLEGLDALSEEEAQAKIKDVYRSHLSTFAQFLNEEANVIAGKTALIDRAFGDGLVGRRLMTFMDTLNRQVGSNMVGYNVSSALTNLIAPVQAFAKTNKFDFIKGFAQLTSNKIKSIQGKGDGFAEQSPVMIRRKGEERFHRTAWQKMSDPGYALMGAVDNFSTELIARAKYNELTRKGMDSETAHIETDKWVSRLMGDRSIGQMPQLYNSKVLGIVTKFQLEVRNQLDSQFYDTIKEAGASTEDIQNGLERNAKKAAKIGSTFFTLAVGQHLFGKAFESIAGYNPAFDIISAIAKALGLDDDDESEDTVLDNFGQALYALAEDMPYSSFFLDGGRVPMANALPDVGQILEGKNDYDQDIGFIPALVENALEIAPYYLLPGGYGQIKKTTQGLAMFDDDLPISGSYTESGKLRFPVEDTLEEMLRAGIFGQYASGNARDYFDNERLPLDEKQTQEFVDSGISIQEYWDYREGLKGLKTLNEKADYIYGLDIPMEAKNLFINNLADREESIDLSGMDGFANFREFDFATKNPEKYEWLTGHGVTVAEYEALDKDTKEEYDYAFRNPEMYEFLKGINVSYGEYKAADDFTKDAYTWAYKNPEKYTLSKAVASDVVTYRTYTSELYDIKADKDEDGKSISGSRKEKVIDYINNLDADYGEKIILFKSEYPSDDTYNYDIIDYLNSRDDISYGEMNTILLELGFKIASDGITITWD